MTPFNWDHPSISISHGIRRYGGPLPKVPHFVRPKASWWTPERMGIAALIWSLCFAILVGIAIGANA